MPATNPHIRVERPRYELFSQLSEDNMPFNTRTDVFIAAVCMGYNIRNKAPLEGETIDLVRWGTVPRENQRALLKALGLVETGDKSVLKDKKKLVTIAEEYANGGINDLYNKLVNKGGSAAMNLIDLMKTE